MYTKGLYGIRKNKIDKCTYNHYDSYPESLGMHIITFCKNYSLEEMNRLYDKIELVGDEPPTSDQIEYCREQGWINDSVNMMLEREDWEEHITWDDILVARQNSLENLNKEKKPFMVDNADFINNSLCEYAYIINLDMNVLEFRVGNQRKPDYMNRYGIEELHGFYPCKLLKAYPLPLDHDVRWYVDDMRIRISELTGE